MSVSANYIITAVRLDSTDTRIDSVRRHRHTNGRMGDAEVATRTKIAYDIQSGLSHITAYEQNGKWYWGDNVSVLNIRGRDFIRTDGNKIERDNLGNLPRF